MRTPIWSSCRSGSTNLRLLAQHGQRTAYRE
jgi:hypothetical protein